ncbi:30124_t:CDS:2, partial [Gigaspora margarita]
MIEQFKHFIRHGKQASKNPPANNGTFEHESKVPFNSQNYTEEKVDNDTAVARIVAEEREQRSRMPIYPGLERYRLLEKMGEVDVHVLYLSITHTTTLTVKREWNVNIKPFGPLPLPIKASRSNILKEVRIMRQLKHKSIVALKSFSESDDYYYLVLELMEGGELFHQIVRLTYFSEQLSRHVIVQVAEGIRYLHEEVGVVHRDIKPENLLFEPIPFIPSKVPKPNLFDEPKEDEGEFIPGVGGGGIGRIKIADFGLSKIVWNEQTMTPCGTVGYTAPEIVKDERYSKSVDMWALGCVLYTMLCGFPPFYDESIRDLTEKVAKGSYSFLSPWWDNISDSSKDLITHLLTVDPEKRYTINQFFEHPWIKEQQIYPKSAIPPAILNDVLNTPGDNPRRKDVISPGISLKEAFDVSCAVHRMEEEGVKRRKIKIGGGGQKAGTRKVAGKPSSSTKHSKEGSKRFNFELNMDKATLLGRRRKVIAEP